jgi:DNA mismatch endonuclease (patch repair protein)
LGIHLSFWALGDTIGEDKAKYDEPAEIVVTGYCVRYQLWPTVTTPEVRRCVLAKAKPFTSDPSEVSARMRLIRGRNTKPELALFSILRAAEIPFKCHVRIGRVEADAMVDNAVLVFVDSPFWHLREARELERLSPLWRERLLRNKRRDDRQRRQLRKRGFSVVRLWADQMKENIVLSRINRILTIKRKTGP